MKTLLLRATAPAVSLASCLVLFGGVASAQADTINNSGDHSTNTISNSTSCESTVTNTTSASLFNGNLQFAGSGDAKVKDNHNVSSVTTGNSSNSNTTSFTMNVTNGGGGCLPRQQQPSGGGQGGGETPTPVTPASTTPTPVGGQGGGEVAALPQAQQVAVVPSGGVGAGEGSPAYLAGLSAITLASGALATKRLQRSFKNRF